MKKILINKITSILSIILILSVASCSKEKSENVVSEGSSQKILITGVDANTTTKTTLNGLVTSWIQTTDKVGIYSTQARTAIAGGGSEIVNAQFTAASSAFSSSFSGTMYWGAANSSHTFYAYYPWTSGTSASTVVPISLPSAQTQSAAGSNAHIGSLDFMVATPVTVTSPTETGATSGVNLKYNHLFTVLEFQIKQSSGNGTITKVKLTSPTTNLSLTSGTINITQSTPGEGVAYTIAGGTGSKEITLTITGGVTPTADYATTPKIYMVILPGDFSAESMTIGLEYQNSGFFESTFKTGKAFERGKKYIVQMDVPTVTDGDGNAYGTVTIGTQTWMASNLKTTKYNDGTDITYVTDNSTWGGRTQGAYCWYNNDASTYKATYGALYNWYAVDNNASTKVASNGGKNICPVGWHVPTDAEWTTLTDYLGGLSVAGDKLKETGTTHWISNTAATNSSGFTALPGGNRKYDGWGYVSLGTSGRWWCSNPSGTDSAIFRYMTNSGSNVPNSPGIRSFGNSVRCVKD